MSTNPDLVQFMQSQEKTNERLTEAITEIAKGQIELKVVQDEIKIISQSQRDTQKEIVELTRRVDANSHTSNDLKEVRKEHRAMGNKLLGSVIFVCICAVAGLFFK
tara:strand:+ start:1849 stop:2166 length:318 start_codon:yes stop_codon:yes gene_type:complete